MRINVVGCGDSAKEWYKLPCDLSIGVNDCVKFGHEVDYLVVVNSPLKFEPYIHNGHTNRLATILNGNPKKFYCHTSAWKSYFPKAELLGFRSFIGNYKKGRVYSSHTSPFVAITLAASMGATEIVIWGVDMITHQRWSAGKRDFDNELHNYRLLFEGLEREGIKVYIGNENTVLKEYLPVYKRV